jgi:hypothetical protein
MSTFPDYLIIFIESFMYPCVCPLFSMCYAYVDVSLLYYIAGICSSKRILNESSVLPIYLTESLCI